MLSLVPPDISRKIKIYFPDIGSKCSEARWIIAEGLKANPRVQVVSSDQQADYCINHRTCRNPKDRLVMIDFADGYNHVAHPGPCLLYMKRSCVIKENNIFRYIPAVLSTEKKMVPIAYAMKYGVGKYTNMQNPKDIDISCFFGTTCKRPIQHHHRSAVARYISNLRRDPAFSKYKIHVGIAGASGYDGRNSTNDVYHKTMIRSKIIVTCNPSMWSGDYRLFESFIGQSMVFVDRMVMPVKHPFEHKKHIYYYHRNDMTDLKNALLHFLEHPEERKQIAIEGQQHVLRYHRPGNRIDEMLQEIDYKKTHGTCMPLDSFAMTQANGISGPLDPPGILKHMIMPPPKPTPSLTKKKPPHKGRPNEKK